MGRLIPSPANGLVLPSALLPSTLKVELGGTAVWTFPGGGSHQVAEASGPESPVSFYTYTLDWAGIYQVVDSGRCDGRWVMAANAPMTTYCTP